MDSNAFFRELLKQHPQLFSQNNRELIINRRPPNVDSQWIQFNPTHQSFAGAQLVHHHWMQGNVAVAIPAPVHVRWHRALHPYP
ncbi:MAG: hypothetical protein KGZ61_02245 [Sandarakinorhabdus sp.]|nr:hypothetical protein [Sandarakinorhabdus sp.]